MSRTPTSSIPALLSVAIAVASVAGGIAVAVTARGGTAPANGEMIFDQPGCGRYEYDGPGHRPRVPPSRPCPAPTPVIRVEQSEQDGVWRFDLDGSRSYDRVGGRIISYRWSIGARARRRSGARIALTLPSAHTETVSLAVIDDSGSGATASVVLRAG